VKENAISHGVGGGHQELSVSTHSVDEAIDRIRTVCNRVRFRRIEVDFQITWWMRWVEWKMEKGYHETLCLDWEAMKKRYEKEEKRLTQRDQAITSGSISIAAEHIEAFVRCIIRPRVTASECVSMKTSNELVKKNIVRIV
jgi:hypothetical protein